MLYLKSKSRFEQVFEKVKKEIFDFQRLLSLIGIIITCDDDDDDHIIIIVIMSISLNATFVMTRSPRFAVFDSGGKFSLLG